MSHVRVLSFAVSLSDGYGAGPNQDLRESARRPGARADGVVLPHAGLAGHVRPGRRRDRYRQPHGRAGLCGIGAWILGRNMFGPIRGPWPDASWRGWWGEEPPYHTPVFVLTHHARTAHDGRWHGVSLCHRWHRGRAGAGRRPPAIVMYALAEAWQPSGSTCRHASSTSCIWPSGPPHRVRVNLLAGLDLHALGYECGESLAGERAFHVILRKVR